eukprot:TRINITY_DN24453_c0_g1_i3.p1 TRINITY_DN24453_c0_g1~~TRINITY_DN24453_c0_g1_i3.p1  ORF type:complete len:102 (+),score=13.70 TRINITY_DN24453_c0_g1_i3:114-419(+)
MIRRPPRSTHCISSAASDVYKRQLILLFNTYRISILLLYLILSFLFSILFFWICFLVTFFLQFNCFIVSPTSSITSIFFLVTFLVFLFSCFSSGRNPCTLR